MPEFKEEDVPLVVEPEVEDAGGESKNKTAEGEHVHYTLKRGRIPAQKKNISAPKANDGVGEIDASEVQSDAIGVGGNNTANNSRKSTEVIDKEPTKKKPSRCGCASQHSKQQKNNSKSDSCSAKPSCKCGGICGFFKKIICFFKGGCKKCKKEQQSPKQARSYRHRSRNQRRRRPQDSSR